MNKAELIAAVAEKTGLSKKDSEKAVNAAVDSIVDTLVAGEKVSLASAHSTSRSAVFALAATPRPARRSKSPQPRFLSSRQARHLRTQSQSNKSLNLAV